ncbi:hypothetical protein T01_5591 [Trichinella spiralis]|uniref:Uncharacterized protein n=1 Tax=Trichinella spiralis TaxID=6334 RepID=A0A0V0ZA74_TRISP|nr:hypothetical protein T01_5591 [Trichinella spiralis]
MARQAIAGLHHGSSRVGLILHSLQDRRIPNGRELKPPELQPPFVKERQQN